ncbi:MAG: hypothetical protein AB7U73_09470 [Pirellulales bacterium]
MDRSSPSIDRLGRVALALGAVLACVAWLGCAQPESGVHGSVTLDGRPLDEAAIVFVPLGEGRRKTGAAVVAGRYQIDARDGLRPGRYRVEFVDQPAFALPNSATVQSGPVSASPPVHTATQARREDRPPRRVLPARYTIASPLTIEFEAGRTVFDFALDSQAED